MCCVQRMLLADSEPVLPSCGQNGATAVLKQAGGSSEKPQSCGVIPVLRETFDAQAHKEISQLLKIHYQAVFNQRHQT